jgi:hypothetical protein
MERRNVKYVNIHGNKERKEKLQRRAELDFGKILWLERVNRIFYSSIWLVFEEAKAYS